MAGLHPKFEGIERETKTPGDHTCCGPRDHPPPEWRLLLLMLMVRGIESFNVVVDQEIEPKADDVSDDHSSVAICKPSDSFLLKDSGYLFSVGHG